VSNSVPSWVYSDVRGGPSSCVFSYWGDFYSLPLLTGWTGCASVPQTLGSKSRGGDQNTAQWAERFKGEKKRVFDGPTKGENYQPEVGGRSTKGGLVSEGRIWDGLGK